MYCGGYEERTQGIPANMEMRPANPEQKPPQNPTRMPITDIPPVSQQENRKALAVRMKMPEKETVIAEGDVALFTIKNPILITNISDAKITGVPVNENGDVSGTSVELTIGDHTIAKDWRLTQLMKEKQNGSWTGLP